MNQTPSGMSIASLILGILSLLLCCIGIGGILGIIGFILGLVVLVNKKSGTGLAITGIITSILGMLLSFIVVVGIINSPDEFSSSSAPPITAASSKSSAEESDSNVNETNAEKTTFGVGESAVQKDVIVTLNDVTESTGSKYVKPADGNVFVLAEFTFENNSDEEISVSSILSFDAYQDKYSTSTSFSALMAKEDAEQLDGTIAPGKKMKGVVGYEIPAEFQELEINVQLNLWSNKKMTFIYQK